MTEELDVRPFASSDASRVADLFTACFGVPTDVGYVRWKYEANPAGEVVAYVAEAGDRLAGFYGVIPEPWSVGGADATVYQSMDTMTHPEFQRRGLFVRLASITYDEVRRRTGRCDLVGIPGRNSYPGLTGKLKWSVAHEFDPIVLPTAVVRVRPHRRVHTSVEPIDRPDPRVHEVLSRASRPEGPAWPRLEGAFFDWRTFGHSPKELRVALASVAGQPVAICVYALTGRHTTMISYLAGVDGADAAEWFAPLLRFVAARRAGALYTWQPRRRSLASLFAHAGFRRNPMRRGPLSQRWPLCVRSDTRLLNGVPWDASTVFDVQPLMQD
jgi:GNAT superfamily N-acetyltransferase